MKNFDAGKQRETKKYTKKEMKIKKNLSFRLRYNKHVSNSANKR